MTMPPRVLHTMIITAGQTVSVLKDAKTLWLPATVIHQAKHGSYLVQVIGGGAVNTHDHICEWHPDAVKPNRSTIADVALATPECSPGMPPVRPSTSSPSHCTCCSSHRPTKPSCSCNYTTHSKEICSAYTTATTEPIHWRCTKQDWLQHLLPLANPPESRSP